MPISLLGAFIFPYPEPKSGSLRAFSSLSKLYSLCNMFFKERGEWIITSREFFRVSRDPHHGETIIPQKGRRLYLLYLSTLCVGKVKAQLLSSLKKLRLTNVLDAKQEIWQNLAGMKYRWQCNIDNKGIRLQDLVQYHLHWWCLWNRQEAHFLLHIQEKRTWHDGKGMDVGARNIQIPNTHLLLTGLLALDKL